MTSTTTVLALSIVAVAVAISVSVSATPFAPVTGIYAGGSDTGVDAAAETGISPPFGAPVMAVASGATTDGSIVSVLTTGDSRLVSAMLPPPVATVVVFAYGGAAMGVGVSVVGLRVTGHLTVVAGVGSATTITWVRLPGQLATAAAQEVMEKVRRVLAVSVVRGTGQSAGAGAGVTAG